MYRLVLYGLLFMAAYSLSLSFFGLLPFEPLPLLFSALILSAVCFFSNLALAKLFKVFVNFESSLITALILFFLLWPPTNPSEGFLLGLAGLIAMSSKYFIAFKGKHLFNPAAFSAFALIFLGSGALWWIATPLLLPVTAIVGLLIVRKIRKFTMFLTFLAVNFSAFFIISSTNGSAFTQSLSAYFGNFIALFFGTIMLTEPLTTPPTKKLQLIYASIVGVIFSLQAPFGYFYPTPEAALLVGNIFSFTVSPKYRLRLKILERLNIAKDTIELIFEKPKNFNFLAGQYLEWTIPFRKADQRGNRRYFTISSSPTEDKVRLGIKLNNPSSSFKKNLLMLKKGEKILAGSLSGDFTLKKGNRDLVFIAGGIGITPFRSLIKNLLDNRDSRKITLFYSNKTIDEIAYQQFLGKASQRLDLKVVYVITEDKDIPKNFNGEHGRISPELLKKYVKNLDSVDYYLSGPISMVNAYKKLLRTLGVKRKSILTDYFPGF